MNNEMKMLEENENGEEKLKIENNGVKLSSSEAK
jgi:hypothetical protein